MTTNIRTATTADIDGILRCRASLDRWLLSATGTTVARSRAEEEEEECRTRQDLMMLFDSDEESACIKVAVGPVSDSPTGIQASVAGAFVRPSAVQRARDGSASPPHLEQGDVLTASECAIANNAAGNALWQVLFCFAAPQVDIGSDIVTSLIYELVDDLRGNRIAALHACIWNDTRTQNHARAFGLAPTKLLSNELCYMEAQAERVLSTAAVAQLLTTHYEPVPYLALGDKRILRIARARHTTDTKVIAKLAYPSLDSEARGWRTDTSWKRICAALTSDGGVPATRADAVDYADRHRAVLKPCLTPTGLAPRAKERFRLAERAW